MIRSVAQTIPAYCMSCFLLPKSLSQDIERTLNGYWWKSGSDGRKGIRWLAWEKMCMSKEKGGLGFRSLYGFNLALLGKHIWHFLHNPNSLVARVFKSRYFPNDHILKVRGSPEASFIWNGICEAKEELVKGFRWIIGDGASINVFSDQWIRGNENLGVEQQYASGSRLEKVREYFRPNTKQWDVTKVQQTFSEIDASCILKLRIPQNQVVDRASWLHTKDGVYTAKSGYHYWTERHAYQDGGGNANGWKRLWKLPVPQKMKYFMWRVCKNNILIRVLLRSKGVQSPIICPMCSNDVEHLRHLFIECQYARNCWELMGNRVDTSAVEELPVWVLERLGSEGEGRLVSMVKVLYGIWWARNSRVWENKLVPPGVVVDTSSRILNEWQEAQKKSDVVTAKKQTRGPEVKVQWQAPEAGWCKVNVDASIHVGDSQFKIGMVFRNDRGEFLEGMTKGFADKVSVLEAKATGVYEALCRATEINARNLIVESDSLAVVNALNKNTTYVSEVGNILEECRTLLQNRSDLKVQYVRRQANRVAHMIAKLPCVSGTRNLLFSPPLDVMEDILYDYSF